MLNPDTIPPEIALPALIVLALVWLVMERAARR